MATPDNANDGDNSASFLCFLLEEKVFFYARAIRRQKAKKNCTKKLLFVFSALCSPRAKLRFNANHDCHEYDVMMLSAAIADLADGRRELKVMT